MADLSNSSFIPKRGPVKKRRRTSSRQVYVFTMVSYVLLFATLLGVGGVFFYGKHIDNQFNQEVADLDAAIKGFSDADMERVIEFDSRLRQASARIDSSVSLMSIFDALEEATIETVQIDSLQLSRTPEDSFQVIASVITDSFDSTIFQRGIYQRNNVVESIEIDGVEKTQKATEGELEVPKTVFLFDAEIKVPFESVPFLPSREPSQVISSPVYPDSDLERNDEEITSDSREKPDEESKTEDVENNADDSTEAEGANQEQI